jgi:hypothetical protein
VNGEKAYEHAYKYAPRTPDGDVIEESLVKLVAAFVDFDIEEQKLNLARRIVARRKRPGQTTPDGVVALPGMEKFAYEPRRLIADDAGHVIENRHAQARHKLAEARRAREAAQSAEDRADQAAREAKHIDEWTESQKQQGREPAALVWDTCLRETGLLIEEAAGGEE